VKNLENVQGDERDVIFISVGYGPDASGYVAMNFGPLSAEGGERRLNVLISRAKLRCEVFASLRAEDIDLARASGRGVRAFKTFLQFAETGRLAAPAQSVGEEMSPFEEAVRRAVEGLGFEVHPQVGVAGFFVDLGVVDPERPGHYVLGIEVSSATAPPIIRRARHATATGCGRPCSRITVGSSIAFGARTGSNARTSNYARSPQPSSRPA